MALVGDYIKLSRKLTSWEWYSNSLMVHLFIHLLLSANWKEGVWRGVVVKRGQIIIGRKKLSNITGISEQTIRTCLERLKSTGEITIKPTNKYTLVTICNYNKYQFTVEAEQPSNQPTNPPATNQQLTTIEEVKNIRIKEIKDKKRTFVQPAIEEVAAYCLERGNGIDPERWHSHYTANGWKVGKNPMKDWKAAVRTWEGRDRAKAPRVRPQGPSLKEQQAMELLGIKESGGENDFIEI